MNKIWPQFNLGLALPCRVRLKSSVPVSAARSAWLPRGAACTRVRCVTMVTYGTTRAASSAPAAGVRSSARGQSVLASNVHRWALVRVKLLPRKRKFSIIFFSEDLQSVYFAFPAFANLTVSIRLGPQVSLNYCFFSNFLCRQWCGSLGFRTLLLHISTEAWDGHSLSKTVISCFFSTPLIFPHINKNWYHFNIHDRMSPR